MKHPNRIGLRYGILAGVGVIAYFLLFYAISKPLMLHFGVWWSSLIIYMVAMLLAIRKIQSTDLRQNIQAGFTTFLAANLLFYLFYYLLFTKLDPQLVDLQKSLLLENSQTGQELAKQDLSVTAKGTLFAYLRSLIGGFIMAAAFSARYSRIN